MLQLSDKLMLNVLNPSTFDSVLNTKDKILLYILRVSSSRIVLNQNEITFYFKQFFGFLVSPKCGNICLRKKHQFLNIFLSFLMFKCTTNIRNPLKIYFNTFCIDVFL